MKKISWLMSLLVAVTMLFAACQPDTPANGDLSFGISIVESAKTSVKVNIEPSDANVDYVVYPCQNSVAMQYDTDEALVAALAETVNFAEYTHKGSLQNYTIDGLKANTAYNLMVFAQQNNVPTSKIVKKSFRTSAVIYINCTFNVEVTVKDNNVDLLVEPSDRAAEWYCCVVEKMKYDELTSQYGEAKMTAAQVVEAKYAEAFAALVEGGMTADEARAELVKTSNRKLSFQGLRSRTEYIYLASAADASGDTMSVMSEVANGVFTTGEAPVAAGEFTMTVSNVGPYGFVLNIEATSDELYYYPCIDFPETFDEAATVAWLDKVFNEQYQNMLIKYKDNPSMVTNELVLEECPYFAHGDKSFGVGNIPPHTNVMGAIFVLRATTGQVAKVHRFDDLATTVEPSTISPTIEVVGVYSGDEENGEVFGNASATAGRAILVSKASNFEGASHLYSIYGTQGGLDATAYPDWRAIWFFTGYWIELIPEQPYNYHVANWDEQGYLYVYTKDADGLEGHVGRCSAVASVLDMGPIDELKEYFAKTGSLETESKSLVIAE